MEESKKVITLLGILMAVVLVLPGLANAGSLTPTAPPAPTMKTLDELYQKLNALEQKVSTIYDNTVSFQPWPDNPRFKVNYNNTPSDVNDDMVLDTQTGLIWTRNANPMGRKNNWQDAITTCDNFVLANKDDWRLPSKDELVTLEPLPTGHPFVNVQQYYYWSSTECTDVTKAYVVDVRYDGSYGCAPKAYGSGVGVWPVRGGN